MLMNANNSDQSIDPSSQKNILVLGINKIYYSLLSIYLKNYISSRFVYASYQDYKLQPDKECFKKADLIIFEFDNRQIELVTSLVKVQRMNALVFYKESHVQSINDWIELGVKGFFNENRSLDHLLEAVKTVQNGKYYISNEDSENFFKNLEVRSVQFKKSLELMTMLSKLSKKEIIVMHAIASNEGSLLKQVSEKLFLSSHTLRNHLRSIYKKINIRNRVDLYIFYQRHEAILTEIMASSTFSKSTKSSRDQFKQGAGNRRYTVNEASYFN